MKNLHKTIAALLFLGVIFTSCVHEKVNSEEEHEEHGPEGMVSLTQKQLKTLGVELVGLQKKNMSNEIQVNGKIELPPQEKADVSPIMGGVVKKIYVIEGDKVRKGQVLAILQHPDFIQLQEDYATAEHEMDYLKEEYNRQKKLHKENVASTTSFQKIKASYEKNKTIVASYKIKLKMLGLNADEIKKGKIYPTINITSPLNGVVSLVETNIGAYVAPMKNLFEIVNTAELHAGFLVYEKDISVLKVGQTIFFQTSSKAGEEFEAKIHNISPAFEKNPRALHIHADILDEKQRFIPGMYINGRILTETSEETVVPNDAIVTEAGKSYIFIKTKQPPHNHEENATNHDEKIDFLMVEIVKGVTNAGFTSIHFLNNLPEGIEIANSNAYFLYSEMIKGELEHEH